MAAHRAFVSVMLTAQDLRSGAVVYWNGYGWTMRIEEGVVAADDRETAALERVLAEAAAGDTVIEAYLEPVGAGVPARLRDRARLRAPAAPHREIRHVPL